MKKRILPVLFPVTLAAVLGLCLCATAGSWNLPALQAQAARAVPGGKVIAQAADDMGCFVGLQKDRMNYQFTMAGDTDPQMPDAEVLDYKGRKSYFFETMPGSGGLMIVLSPERSLTILCMPGFDAETELKAADLTALADRMDLDAL